MVLTRNTLTFNLNLTVTLQVRNKVLAADEPQPSFSLQT